MSEHSPLKRNLESMLDRGQDSALLRYTLGGECLKAGDPLAAIEHYERSIVLDPGYSAAWRQLGKAAQAIGDQDRAREAWREGIATARARGDVQAAKEMSVFLRRLEKSAEAGRERGEER